MNLLDRINQFPPNCCRLVARKKHGTMPMTTEEIAEKSGLSVGAVSEISRRKNWNGMRIEVIVAFSEACGVNLLKPERHIRYMRNRKMAHLSNGTHDQRKLFGTLLKAA